MAAAPKADALAASVMIVVQTYVREDIHHLITADLALSPHYHVIPTEDPVKAFHAAYLNCRWHAGRDAGGVRKVRDSLECFALRSGADVPTPSYPLLVD